jgi:uncharacterized protein DUF559
VASTALRSKPISVAEAGRYSIDWDQLQRTAWRRVGPGQYASSALPDTPELRLTAVHLRLPAGTAFAGRTAAWLHGLDLPPCDPIEVVASPAVGISGRVGVLVRRQAINDSDIVIRRGFPATSPLRTMTDLAWRLPLVDAVAAADMALHAGLVTLDELRARAIALNQRKGVKALRRVIELAEPAAESPMETRLRLMLILAGLPRPEVQRPLIGDGGRFLARADLFYPEKQLVIEFDGSTHKTSLVEDSRRQNRLISAGYSILRFTTSDVLGSPDSLVMQIRQALM